MKRARLRRKSPRASRNARMDALAKRLMIARHGDRCIAPAVSLQDGRCGRQPVQACHIYPKGQHRAMQHVVSNLIPLCYHHHFHWWHKHPVAAHEWAVDCFPGTMARLRIMSLTLRKVDKAAEELMLMQECERNGA